MLAAMADKPQSRGGVVTDAESLPPDPFAWTPDPVVAVCRRERVLYVPGVLLRRDPSDAEKRRWRDPAGRPENRAEVGLRLLIGATFLGAYATSWDLRGVDGPHAAPSREPSEDRLRLLLPPSLRVEQFDPGDRDRDRPGAPLRPDRAHAGVLRALAWVHEQDAEGLRAGTVVEPGLFSAGLSHDAPEVALLPLSEVLAQRTQAGVQSFALVLAAIPYVRDAGHLGALHDYAVRVPAARSIVDACRRRAAFFGQRIAAA